MCVGLVATVLAVVKLTSITTGPSANEAIVAIRVAQRELFEAKRVYLEPTPRALNNAEAALELALSALKERRYEEAILAARETSQLVRKLGG
ncbi:MAG: hypothetical protein HY695_08010 [Deltaproteobacteria bacterium]|nr:hypothetical protein [Deltaproteobacteria bacterium]